MSTIGCYIDVYLVDMNVHPTRMSFFMMKRALSFLILLPLLAAAQDEASPTGYVLATGDVIYVRVYDEDDLSMRLTVPGDGTVRYAFVGDFKLAGRTIDQIEQEVTQRLLGDYLVNPWVLVICLISIFALERPYRGMTGIRKKRSSITRGMSTC